MTANAHLPGVTGVVGLVNDPFRGHVLTLDGKPVKREKGQFHLPGESGEPVTVGMKGRYLTEHPIIRIGDKDFLTGAPTPPFLVVVTFLPLLFLLGGGVIGVVLAVLGVAFNAFILRSPRTETWKVFVILIGFIAAVVFLVFWAFFSSWVLGLFPHP